MSHMVESMAYRSRDAKDVPWHGLGNAIDHEMDVEEMLKAAGLDWKVQRRIVRMNVAKGNQTTMEIPGYLAITRDIDNKVYQIASDRYHPLQNNQILGFFKEFAQAGEMHLETAGSLKEGAVVWALASIDDSFTLPGGDKVKGYLLLANSHDGSMTFNGRFTSVRVVCWNTLCSARGEKSDGRTFSMRHTHKFTKADEMAAREKLGLCRKELHALERNAQVLVEAQVDPKGQEVLRYVAMLMQPDLLATISDETEFQQKAQAGALTLEDLADDYTRSKALKRLQSGSFNAPGRAVLDSILNSPGAGMDSAKGTWWGVLSGVTNYVDHEAGRNRDSGLTSAWFGSGAQRKADALDLALQFAQVAPRMAA